VRERQVKPAFEMAGHGRDQQRAELGGEGVVAGGASPGRHALEGHARLRTQFQQALGVFAGHVEIVLGHAD
jgi:hypothetical protein